MIVNVVVLLVPVAGLELARLYEHQLLHALERDMRNQAALVREAIEAGLERDRPLRDGYIERILEEAARTTRTRVRILDAGGQVILDSHRGGPPEGAEPPAPTVLPPDVYGEGPWSTRSLPQDRWPDVPDRREVRSALRGNPDAQTRLRERAPAVFLFVAEPIRRSGEIAGVVYVTRSTLPVLEELYRIRTGLLKVLGVALALTLLVSLGLAWSISRPLSRLAKAARRIAGGERGVAVPVGGGGEIHELGEALATMTARLDGRMRYIRDFAADVAHELKSPLTSIRGAAELLSEGAADDPEARARFLSNIELESERLDRLVSRLLELSRIDASDAPMDDVDLGALVARVVERTHTGEQPVEIEWQTSLRSVRGRAEELERALLNLVENALRFSPEGAPVTIRVAASPSEVSIAVIDRGPGVPKELERKIFDRFFTTDADRNGTGLGLAIVQSVARAHGGAVELASQPGRGACFTLRLPRR
ncbi:MAG: HAMP domain-containing protein [Sandaracinaceae bacterium]|nr:HAMP domain-containing protein [Sandaracinaceae bacterium]